MGSNPTRGAHVYGLSEADETHPCSKAAPCSPILALRKRGGFAFVPFPGMAEIFDWSKTRPAHLRPQSPGSRPVPFGRTRHVHTRAETKERQTSKVRAGWRLKNVQSTACGEINGQRSLQFRRGAAATCPHPSARQGPRIARRPSRAGRDCRSATSFPLHSCR